MQSTIRTIQLAFNRYWRKEFKVKIVKIIEDSAEWPWNVSVLWKNEYETWKCRKREILMELRYLCTAVNIYVHNRTLNSVYFNAIYNIICKYWNAITYMEKLTHFNLIEHCFWMLSNTSRLILTLDTYASNTAAFDQFFVTARKADWEEKVMEAVARNIETRRQWDTVKPEVAREGRFLDVSRWFRRVERVCLASLLAVS